MKWNVFCFEMKIESLDNNFFQVALKYKRIGYCIKRLRGIRGFLRLELKKIAVERKKQRLQEKWSGFLLWQK